MNDITSTRRARARRRHLVRMAALAIGLAGAAACASPMPGVPKPPTTSKPCHASYTPCVPVASDVDCRGGSGDGPVYVGQVKVIGPDVYGLDADHDGVGCES